MTTKVQPRKTCGPPVLKGAHGEGVDRLCLARPAMTLSPFPRLSGAPGNVVGDYRRDCSGGSWWPSFCLSQAEVVQPDISASQFWGPQQSNDKEALNVSARWEKKAAIEGTLSTERYKDSVHPVQPAQQGPNAATSGDVTEFWRTADVKTKNAELNGRHAGSSGRVPERGCFGNVRVAK